MSFDHPYRLTYMFDNSGRINIYLFYLFVCGTCSFVKVGISNNDAINCCVSYE